MELILAIDTATSKASLALWSPYEVLAEETWLSRRNHSVELAVSVARMMERQGLEPTELTGLAVSQGPGSFTGLRIGMALGKGLALALDIPLVAVPTLEVLAYAQATRFMPVRAVLKAGRGRLCWADFRWRRNRWHQQDDTVLGHPEDVVQNVSERTLFCGELDKDVVELIGTMLGPAAVIASPAEGLRRAAFLAELAYRRLSREKVDLTSVAPVYLMPEGQKG